MYQTKVDHENVASQILPHTGVADSPLKVAKPRLPTPWQESGVSVNIRPYYFFYSMCGGCDVELESLVRSWIRYRPHAYLDAFPASRAGVGMGPPWGEHGSP